MNTLLLLLQISLLPTGLLLAQTDQSPSFTAKQLQFFETKIRPLLAEHCYQCHSGDRLKGGLNLESRQALLQGADVLAACFIVDLPELGGADKIRKLGVPVRTLVGFEGH